MRWLIGLACVLALPMSLVSCGNDSSGVCSSFCAKDTECYPPEDQIPRCDEWCGYLLDVAADNSAECGAAMTDMFACVSDLQTCEEVDGWWFEDPWDSYPCKAADDAANSACEGGSSGAGELCDTTADCVSGLECLPLGQWDGSTCTVVATVCTHLCTVTADCADLGTDYLCFLMCDGRRSCGRTG